jgi:hypothetical protein
MGGVERILSDARLRYKLSQDNGTSNGHLSAVMNVGNTQDPLIFSAIQVADFTHDAFQAGITRL